MIEQCIECIAGKGDQGSLLAGRSGNEKRDGDFETVQNEAGIDGRSDVEKHIKYYTVLKL